MGNTGIGLMINVMDSQHKGSGGRGHVDFAVAHV